MDIGEPNRVLARLSKKAKTLPVLPEDTELDRLFVRTLQAGKDEAKKLRALYGPVLCVTSPLKVTIHGACINAGKILAAAGSVAYWGPDARLNSSARVWGNQTSPCSELLSALLAIKSAPIFKSLEISTCSEYVVCSITYYAAANEACGWRCANGDILKCILLAIKNRMAPLHFRRIK
ncbi:hypothetical protein K438DRAFT_1588306, partial [Mycena galopus ATCC 62051]